MSGSLLLTPPPSAGERLHLAGIFPKSGVSGCTLLWENTLRHLAFGIYNIRMALDCNIILGGFLTEYLVPYFPRLREYAAALNPFESTADYLHLSVLRKHTISLGVSLHFVVEFLKYV